MELTPKRIYEEVTKKNLDISSAFKMLSSIIENSSNEDVRIESFKVLEKIGVIDNKSYKFIENLLISDSSWEIRNAAAYCLTEKFQNRAIQPLKWAIKYEEIYECLITIINSFVKLKTQESKQILIDEVKKIKKRKYLFSDAKVMNKLFKKQLKELFKNRKIEDFTHMELADIIINYKTIIALKKNFFNVYYELENGKVIKLDLSDVEFEVRGWKSEFNNNIQDLLDIPGLKNLKHLKYLYLSNNHISNIKALLELPNLSHLYISKNMLVEKQNIEYIKQMANQNHLRYINISGNKIVNQIVIQEFNPKLEIIMKTPFYF